jgi:hypothetical protein
MRLVARELERNHMRVLGISRTGRIGRWYNGLAYSPAVSYRRAQYEDRFGELLRENGGGRANRIEMHDGLALDESHLLPHLDRVLSEGAAIVEERGGHQWNPERPYLQDIQGEDAVERYPSLLDFATASEVVGPVARHFGYVPQLSHSRLPLGVRVMESSTKFDPQPAGPWRASQLWHRDYHSSPTFYVIVLLRETGPENGPLHYLPKSTSDRVAAELRYGSRGAPYRVTDEVMYSLVDRAEVRTLCGPPGTVLFIDSSQCFHFGSRNPATPRYQVQYAYVSPIRNDFGDILRPQRGFPIRGGDSELRGLVLDRTPGTG